MTQSCGKLPEIDYSSRSGDLPLVQACAEPLNTVSADIEIMEIAHYRQARSEPRCVSFVEVWRTDVLGPTKPVPIANSEVVAAYKLETEVQRPLQNRKRPLLARANQSGGPRFEKPAKSRHALD